MRQIQFTNDPRANESVLPWESGWLTYRGLGFYTLAAWAESMKCVYPNPETVAFSIQAGAKGILTLRDDGEFISWK